jgi:hypothetical protein
LSTRVNDPEEELTAVGENITEIVHVAAGRTAAVQVLVWAKGAGAVTLVNCSGPVPVLVTVMVLAELVVPSTSDPKLSDAGDTETAGAVPVPESATV